MHNFFFFSIWFIIYLFLPPYHPPVWMTHAHCRTCVCMCMLPEHDNWVPSFTLFFPIRLVFYLTFIFLFFFSNSICFAYFFIWLALVGAWYFETEECVYILFFCFMRLCFMCHLLVPVSFYFILFFTRKSVVIILLLNSMELASGLVFPCLPVFIIS